MIAYTIAYAYAAVLVAVVGSLSSPAYGFSFSTRAPRSIRHIISPLLSVATPTDSVTTPVESGQQASALQTEDTDDDPFTLLSTLAATTLLQSDRRRDAVGKEAGAQASSGEKEKKISEYDLTLQMSSPPNN